MGSGAGYRHTTVVNEGLTRYMDEMGPGNNLDFLRRLKWATQGSTIHVVSNCQDVTDWDISDSSAFNAVDEATVVNYGDNSLELFDITSTTGTFVTLDAGHRPVDEDWTEFNWMCFSICDAVARTAGEYTFQIRNNGEWSAEVAVPTITTVAMFETVCADISGLDKGNVDGFRFVNQRGTGSSEKVYVDSIIVTDIITGTGDGDAIGTGPVIGPIRSFPLIIGATILPGDAVQWEVGGVNTGSGNDAALLGIACQSTAYSSLVSAEATPKEIFIACQGAVVYLRNDGSGMSVGEPGILGSDVVTEGAGTATGNAEYGFCVSLENSAGTYLVSGDSAYVLAVASSED